MNWIELTRAELQVDAWDGDVTASLLSGYDKPSNALIFSRVPGVLCGAPVLTALTAILPSLKVRNALVDGSRLEPGQAIAVLEGPAQDLLRTERVILNIMAYLSGVATLTREFVDAVQGFPVKILATRKTVPGLRAFQLYAVQCGGGHVHRRSLSDGILIKDNHQQIVSGTLLMQKAKQSRSPLHGIEVEVTSLKMLEEILPLDPDVIMLDNMDLATMKAAVALIDRRCRIEVSGGVNLTSVRDIAALGVDYISVGRLTHSAPCLDLSLDLSVRNS